MKLIIDIDENELTEEEIQEAIRIAEIDFSGVKIVDDDVLDKIRAEIEKISTVPFATAYTAKSEALEIIDKYKAGKEQ